MLAGNRSKTVRIIFLILGLWLITQRGASQEAPGAQTVPDALRVPERGEAPRYPNDLVIGELGQGQTSEGAYLFARSIISALVEGRTGAQVFTDSGNIPAESLFNEVRSLRPRNYRLGGGRTETDGCVSFLVRIIGPEESITGELFIRQT